MKAKWENPTLTVLGVENTERDAIKAECHGWKPNGECQINPSGVDVFTFNGGQKFNPNSNPEYLEWRDLHMNSCDGPPGDSITNWDPLLFFGS